MANRSTWEVPISLALVCQVKLKWACSFVDLLLVKLKSFGIMQLNLVFLLSLHRPGNGGAHLIGPANGPLNCNYPGFRS